MKKVVCIKCGSSEVRKVENQFELTDILYLILWPYTLMLIAAGVAVFLVYDLWGLIIRGKKHNLLCTKVMPLTFNTYYCTECKRNFRK